MYECFIVAKSAAATWKEASDTPQPVSEYPGNNRQIVIKVIYYLYFIGMMKEAKESGEGKTTVKQAMPLTLPEFSGNKD